MRVRWCKTHELSFDAPLDTVCAAVLTGEAGCVVAEGWAVEDTGNLYQLGEGDAVKPWRGYLTTMIGNGALLRVGEEPE